MPNLTSPIAAVRRRQRGSAKSQAPRLHWHHRVHQEWARERLHFWRLGFDPTYDRDAIQEAIKQTFQERDVLSYAVYELTGTYDIVIRMWLPMSCTLQKFKEALWTNLADKHIAVLDVFILTTDPIMHWVFDDPDSQSLREPRLQSRLPDSEIELINEGNLPEDRRREYENDGLIARTPHHEGIKFFVAIPAPQTARARAIDAFKRELVRIVRSASDIEEKSLYEGEGFAQFLIMGRVPFEKFSRLRTEILDKINSTNISATFGVRTYTFLSLLEDFVGDLFQEKLPTATEAVLPTVVDYLTIYESSRLEVKASAFADWTRWLVKQEGDHPQHVDRVTDEGVLRAVVGFLNAEGGVIVIGALERRQFPRDPVRSLLTKYPAVGEYYLVGIGEDMRGSDWDAYQRKLLNVLNRRITPMAGPWIRIEKQSSNGIDLCVLTVLQTTANWYYIADDPQFYVRQENTTQPLPGIDADAYKRERPRPF